MRRIRAMAMPPRMVTFPLAAAVLGAATTVDAELPARTADLLFAEAGALVEAGRRDEALATLRAALESGLADPLRIRTDPALTPLIADPESRPRVRELLCEHARTSAGVMVPEAEPGERIVVRVTVASGRGGAPVPGARVELVHTDATGRYFPEDSDFNPRLFGCLVASPEGLVVMETIRPGAYPDEGNGSVPAHMHFNIRADGFRDHNSEFLFEDDPLLQGDRPFAMDPDEPVARREDGDGIPTYAVTIPLHPRNR